MVTINIDLGGSLIKIGVLRNRKLVSVISEKAEPFNGLINNLPKIEEIIDRILVDENIDADDFMGIGISFPGLVNPGSKKVLSTLKKYEDALDLNLEDWARHKWKVPLFIENDARVALLGEWQHGVGAGYNDILMITLGTGIGTAVMIDGKLLVGKHFQAGNLGSHITVNYNGDLCPCGNIGCMESESSTWRLPELIRSASGFENSLMKNEKTLDYESLFRNASKNDPVALKVLNHCYLVWASGIISMIHAFDPEIVILSGGIMKSAGLIIPELQKRIDKHAWTDWGNVKIYPAKHINSAALYGCDYIIRRALLKNQN